MFFGVVSLWLMIAAGYRAALGETYLSIPGIAAALLAIAVYSRLRAGGQPRFLHASCALERIDAVALLCWPPTDVPASGPT